MSRNYLSQSQGLPHSWYRVHVVFTGCSKYLISFCVCTFFVPMCTFSFRLRNTMLILASFFKVWRFFRFAVLVYPALSLDVLPFVKPWSDSCGNMIILLL